MAFNFQNQTATMAQQPQRALRPGGFNSQSMTANTPASPTMFASPNMPAPPLAGANPNMPAIMPQPPMAAGLSPPPMAQPAAAGPMVPPTGVPGSPDQQPWSGGQWGGNRFLPPGIGMRRAAGQGLPPGIQSRLDDGWQFSGVSSSAGSQQPWWSLPSPEGNQYWSPGRLSPDQLSGNPGGEAAGMVSPEGGPGYSRWINALAAYGI